MENFIFCTVFWTFFIIKPFLFIPPSCLLDFRKNWETSFIRDTRVTLYKKWSFPLRIFSVNVTKSAGNCGFGHIYWRNPPWKTSFCVQCSCLDDLHIFYMPYEHNTCLHFLRATLRIWSHLPKKFLMENFIFCAVCLTCLFFISFLHALHQSHFQWRFSFFMRKRNRFLAYVLL